MISHSMPFMILLTIILQDICVILFYIKLSCPDILSLHYIEYDGKMSSVILFEILFYNKIILIFYKS